MPRHACCRLTVALCLAVLLGTTTTAATKKPSSSSTESAFSYVTDLVKYIGDLAVRNVITLDESDSELPIQKENEEIIKILPWNSSSIADPTLRPAKFKYTVEELLSQRFPHKVSAGIDLDPCKADNFQGDIALPNIEYELEYQQQKHNDSVQDQVRKMALLEGLQVEEEGLPEFRKKQESGAGGSAGETSQSGPFVHNGQVVAPGDLAVLLDPNLPRVHNGEVVRESYVEHETAVEHETPAEQRRREQKRQAAVKAKKKSAVEGPDDSVNEDIDFGDIMIDSAVETEPRNTTSTTLSTTTLTTSSTPSTKRTGRRKKKNHTAVITSPTIDGEEPITSTAKLPRRKNKQEIMSVDTTTSNPSEVTTLSHRKSRRGRKKEKVPKTEGTLKTDDKEVNKTTSAEEIRRHRGHENSRKKPKKKISQWEEMTDLGTGEKVVQNMSALEADNRRQWQDSHPGQGEVKKGKHRKQGRRNRPDRPQSTFIKAQSTPTKSRSTQSQSRSTPTKSLSAPIQNRSTSWSSGTSLTGQSTHVATSQRTSSRRRARAATARKERIWDNGVIPYEIDPSFSGSLKALFKQAMRHWENSTCVKFVERVPEEHPNYILFTERPCGCCSFVGKRGNGPQAISIGKNCDKFGIVVHELGHVVGFWHEHTRPDRDNHVQIERDNILSGQEYNFNKLTEEEVNSLGLPYDYDSIMHYARNTFSKGTYLDTIHPIHPIRGKKKLEIGQRIRLSEGDIAQTNLLYKCHRCGRTHQENSGIIQSPRMSSSTTAVSTTGVERCEWRVTATHGERIVLNITQLDIVQSEGCHYDYLEVRDGYWHRAPLLGRFCGDTLSSEPIVSTGSRLLITYIATYRQAGHLGFSAYYEAVCGGDILIDASGKLESPNFPDDYLPNKECVWRLTAPPDYQVALTFSSFEVENHDNCFYDYVAVHDGNDTDAPLLGTYCGINLPPDIHSTGNQLLVKFLSDGSVQKGGFSATYLKEFDECARTDHGCEHKCVNTLGNYECKCKIGYELHSDNKKCEDACGGVLDSENGTITSPSFPETYPGNKKCLWEIIAPPTYRITLNFTHFDLEGNDVHPSECEYDRLVVYHKMSAGKVRKQGVYCGRRTPPLITSEGNALRIEFYSDQTVEKSGFAAVFFTDKDECAIDNGGCQHECRNTLGSYVCSCHNGFTLHENGRDCKEGGCKYEISAPHGTVSSPNWPDYYPARKDCIWHFTTTPGHRIKLVFSQFQMESHQECAYDHIVIYDGDSTDAHTLGRFCGNKLPHHIIATSNQMFMVFKSDASVQLRGFFATHSTVCGGHLLATSRVQHLYSHAKFGDLSYDNNAMCEWAIEAAPGAGPDIHLTFLTFELESEAECLYDYVEVFTGLDASGASFGRSCQANPGEIKGEDALLVRFRSDDTVVAKGFSAAYVAVDPSEEDLILRRQEEDEENE